MVDINYSLETLTGKHGGLLEVVEAIVSDDRLIVILTDEDVLQRRDAPLKSVFYRLVLPLAPARCAVEVRARLNSAVAGRRGSNCGGARSRGWNRGVSALATFSARMRWRSWCQCIRVRSIENRGMLEMVMGSAQRVCRLPRAGTGRQTLPTSWLMGG